MARIDKHGLRINGLPRASGETKNTRWTHAVIYYNTEFDEFKAAFNPEQG